MKGLKVFLAENQRLWLLSFRGKGPFGFIPQTMLVSFWISLDYLESGMEI